MSVLDFWDQIGVCLEKDADNEGTNLWVFEDLVFFPPLLEEDFVLAVSRPR